MSIATLPRLVEGQRLDQPTFHERYEAMPPGIRAELIGGVVSMPSPIGYDHGDAQVAVILWLAHYAEATPGVQVLNNATVILDRDNEPQPDVSLRVRPEYGGRTANLGHYVSGAPELVVEVARASRDLDLGPKLEQYERAGILEYVVRASDPDEVLWHTLEDGRYVVVPPDADGLHHSLAFPGLRLDPSALLRGDRAAVDLGLATPEHASFNDRLAAFVGA